MDLPTYFTDFLKNIRPEPDDLEEFRAAHKDLREKLEADIGLSDIILSTFLQGSYRRATAIRPKPGKKGDVDVVVVTDIDKSQKTPQQALDTFKPFLDKHYKGQYVIQGRSIGISLKRVDLDLVATSAPSEVEKSVWRSMSFTEDRTLEDEEFVEKMTREAAEWKLSPLEIPDREAKLWVPTHPLKQIQVTQEKNARCNKHFVNVVKAIKWWRRKFVTPEYPKSYPVEHLIWHCCPDQIKTVAQGVTETLETIVQNHKLKPFLPDHGVPQHDVFKRIIQKDYDEFYSQVAEAAVLARKALDEQDTEKSAKLWRELFGNDFPPYGGGTGDGGNGGSKGGYTPRDRPSNVGGARFG